MIKSIYANNYKDPSYFLGIHGGISNIYGHYEKQMDLGKYFDLFFAHILFSTNKNIFLNYEADYNYYGLDKSNNSQLTCFTFSMGPLYYIPYHKYFNVFSSINVSANYLDLKADLSNKRERTIKPGLKFTLGITAYLTTDIAVDFKTNYKVFELSNQTFQSVNYTAGVLYAFYLPDDRELEKKRRELELKKLNKLYDEALEYYNNGKIIRARQLFEKAYELDKYFKNSGFFIKKIIQLEADYNEAIKQFEQNKYKQAISLLEKIASKYNKAHQKLNELRARMTPKIENLLNEGIIAYEKYNYDKCIQNMEEILIIKPDHETAKIYLQKAKTRKKALKNLR